MVKCSLTFFIIVQENLATQTATINYKFSELIQNVLDTFAKIMETKTTDRFQTPARFGWGKTANILHPHLARLGKLGPLGGRLKVISKKEYDKKLEKQKLEREREIRKQELKEIAEEEAYEKKRFISNLGEPQIDFKNLIVNWQQTLSLTFKSIIHTRSHIFKVKLKSEKSNNYPFTVKY